MILFHESIQTIQILLIAPSNKSPITEFKAIAQLKKATGNSQKNILILRIINFTLFLLKS